jgi:hypothetical protein
VSVFTTDELAELAEPPRDAVARLLAAGDRAGAAVVVARMEAELAGQIDRYTHWIATILAFVADRHGPAGSAAALHATRDFFARWTELGPIGVELPTSVVGGSGDDFVAAEQQWRTAVDLHRDWICALLSDLYRRHGVDELEAVHRRVGEGTMAGLTAAIDAPVRERWERFVWLLKGHFSELALEERPDALVITQDPCGTCGRQARDGRYGPPLDLAVVTDAHRVTWGKGDTTIYRTHVPVWHVDLATAQLGVPWPVNLCPRSPADGPCTIVLFKDPRDPAARAALEAGS